MKELGLRTYVKTSGADGMHILVPIERRHTFEEAHSFAEAAAGVLEARHPGVVTTEWLRAKRKGVLIDYHQNGAGRTTASVYSLRPKPGASVSTPLRWEELEDGLDRRAFTIDVVLRRIEEDGDSFEPVLGGGQSLDAAVADLATIAAG
jgi:bifunctional non-homologous end joining protein LigD